MLLQQVGLKHLQGLEVALEVAGLVPEVVRHQLQVLELHRLLLFVDEARPIVMELLFDAGRHLLEEVGVEVDVEPGSHDGCRLWTVGVGGFVNAQ